MALEKKLHEVYAVARKAREKGLDPVFYPEIEVAKDLASLVEGMVGPQDVAERIRELSKKMPREELSFKVAEEIVYGKFGHLHKREAAEQAIRTALAILTEGITAAPLQGVERVSIKENPDKTNYLAVYFAGPIRSAGGTDQALILVVADFVRQLLGLDHYKPTQEEIARFIEEIRLFERTLGRFQYKVSDEELKNALESLPVEVTGIQSDPVEVSSFRNLPRIETNCVRGGALRVVNDGVIGRSMKAWTIVEKLGIEGWNWLTKIREIKEKKATDFMEEVIAGRPVFSFPSRHGGFRLRYGRARNTGLAAVGVHPATMVILQQFLAAGTQLRLEGPGKGGVVLPVDVIEPPVIKLKDGSVIRVSAENVDLVKDQIDKILFVGDLLVSFGEFLYNNKPLQKSGITEEWWILQLKDVIQKDFNEDLERVSEKTQIPISRLEAIICDPFQNKPNALEAMALASNLKVVLHPRFTYFWECISPEDFHNIRNWLLKSEIKVEKDVIQKIIGDIDGIVKQLLEKICIPHKVVNNKIEIENDDALIFATCLGWALQKTEYSSKAVLKLIYELSGIKVMEKAPTSVGARMGRPEKAKRREMRPMVHVLFPIGLAGGSQRNLVEAMNNGGISVELVRRRCPSCRETSFTTKCSKCNVETIVERFCPQCKRIFRENICPRCGIPTKSYEKQTVDLKGALMHACNRLNLPIPTIVKGVKGLYNETKTAEIVEKGILRARYDLSVYKDGTIRFDSTNAPLTHFKADEIGVSVEKLRLLGYLHDCKGEPLTYLQQICELKMQDIVIPSNCAAYFVRLANFLDDLLEKVYGLQPFYNVKCVEDLLGHVVIGLAPHTSVGILGRIIGFTDLNVCFAHPLWHSAKRRDCDGDEDTLMLALDTVLNFSKVYLPAQIGGIMDAPLFILPLVNPKEVQRQAHELDVAAFYPLAFYKSAEENLPAQKIKDTIDLVEHRLDSEAQFEGYNYTVPVSNINLCNRNSMYKKLGRMIDKLNSQLMLAEKIEAVDAKRVALKVLTTHFMRDISGNLRAFSTQNFRCKSCNKKFRRIPLQGKCTECGGVLTLTVYRGGIEKYLEAAQQLIKKYELPLYYLQQLSLINEEINSLFENKKSKQVSLKDFMS
jgi:DNA polymerase II large subunit